MSLKGLSASEVEERKASGLANGEEGRTGRTYLDIFLKNALTPFNIILMILGASLIICDDPINAVAATGVIILNILISTVQECKAKHRLDKIAVLMRPTATVIRDGEEVTIDRAEIVMDDIIHLTAGEQAQVDGEVLECRSAEMDESLLTGESRTIKKQPGDVIFSGSSCVSGECYFRVDKVGEETFSAKMTAAARKFEKKSTPLQKETTAATEALMILAFIFLFVSVILNLVRGMFSVNDTLREFVIILDIVPIALFLLITITYMVTAVRMADSGVLLQNSSSVESMSHVDTVCMDKTGTITTNRLVFDDVTYIGDPERSERLIAEMCATTGSMNRTMQAVKDRFGTRDAELLDEIQFSSERKYSAVRVKGEGTDTVFMGAWNVLGPHTQGSGTVDETVASLASRGLRAIVFCDAHGADIHSGEEDVVPALEPIAVVAIRDEVRPDCREIIQDFTGNGMDVKVISGDDPDTVEALFALAEIPGERKRVSGDQLDAMTPEEFDKAALETNIFGRMRPDQKENVIDALRRNGRYVAMVGDGVNDVRSIKKADVGVAMETGSSAARGVADMILIKDNFKALPRAIVEGKRTVSGMRDILRLYLTRNIILAFLVFIMLLIFGTKPMEPIQNMAYAFLTVTVAAFFLTFASKPTDSRELILPRVIRYGAPVSVLSVIGSLIIYLAVYYSCVEGYIDMDAIIDSMVTMANNAGLSPGSVDKSLSPDYWTHDNMIEFISGGDSLALTFGKNAMLLFLILTGILQLILLFPPIKKLDWDVDNRRSAIPMGIFVLMIAAVAAIYTYAPGYAATFLKVICFDSTIWLFIIAMSVVWYVVTLLVLRSRIMKRLDRWSEKIARKVLEDQRWFHRKKKDQEVPKEE